METHSNLKKEVLFCPMIDARRMEVFTAVYDRGLNEIIEPAALILQKNSFEGLIQKHPFFYFGSGAQKFEKIAQHSENLNYLLSEVSTEALAAFSWNKFQEKSFENLIKSHPFYVKDFYTSAKIH